MLFYCVIFLSMQTGTNGFVLLVSIFLCIILLSATKSLKALLCFSIGFVYFLCSFKLYVTITLCSIFRLYLFFI